MIYLLTKRKGRAMVRTSQQARVERVAVRMVGLVVDEVGCEAQWIDAPMIDQPTRCFRCEGLIVNDQEARRLWRCVNCGCRGEGWTVFGATVGYAERPDREPQIGGAQTSAYKGGYDGDEGDED